MILNKEQKSNLIDCINVIFKNLETTTFGQAVLIKEKWQNLTLENIHNAYLHNFGNNRNSLLEANSLSLILFIAKQSLENIRTKNNVRMDSLEIKNTLQAIDDLGAAFLEIDNDQKTPNYPEFIAELKRVQQHQQDLLRKLDDVQRKLDDLSLEQKNVRDELKTKASSAEVTGVAKSISELNSRVDLLTAKVSAIEGKSQHTSLKIFK